VEAKQYCRLSGKGPVEIWILLRTAQSFSIDNRPRFGDNHISGCYDKIKPQAQNYARRIGRELE